tara:strand:+ start:857 stop:1090 length:234 start_codon:yes stop_codon:yes gene_type:complete
MSPPRPLPSLTLLRPPRPFRTTRPVRTQNITRRAQQLAFRTKSPTSVLDLGRGKTKRKRRKTYKRRKSKRKSTKKRK